jgi:protein-tyrosine-phosphatase
MKIVFVCYGNICRSPMAEALFRFMRRDRPALQDIEVASAGIGALDGNCATGEALEVLRDEFGLDLTDHRARHFSSIGDADLVLALDAYTRAAIERTRPGMKVETLGEFAGTGEDVADPYGRSTRVYRECARHVRALVAAAVERLEAELSGRASSGPADRGPTSG